MKIAVAHTVIGTDTAAQTVTVFGSVVSYTLEAGNGVATVTRHIHGRDDEQIVSGVGEVVAFWSMVARWAMAEDVTEGRVIAQFAQVVAKMPTERLVKTVATCTFDGYCAIIGRTKSKAAFMDHIDNLLSSATGRCDGDGAVFITMWDTLNEDFRVNPRVVKP